MPAENASELPALTPKAQAPATNPTTKAVRWRRLRTALHLLACASLLFFGCVRGGAFMVVPVLPFFLLWLGWSGYVIWRQPARRKRQYALIGLWLFGIALPLGLAQWRAPRIRAEAERILVQVETYHQQHGSYPERLEDIGMNSLQTQVGWGIHYGLLDNGSGTPILSHQSAHNMFDFYTWDYTNQRWEFQPD
ncbi:hypothetical protein [Uliginosibacterium gangwonense]|uniref:hypothetical protein n=1 Tax=Uliginosibacterium gangwonense TaxID=392736 RepID=UPI000366F1FA|nr:hypothetical protein [Uliginosibacterium gangwonense]